jgi:hypothetical protein
MRHRGTWALWSGLLALGFCAATRDLSAQPAAPSATLSAGLTEVPLEAIPPGLRDSVRLVLEHPTMSVPGPSELFRGRPGLYHWFIDHPEQALETWRRLGAKCTEVKPVGPGRWRWRDGSGSEVYWMTIYATQHVRVWYAEGKARPGPLLPLLPVRAVAVLRFTDGQDYIGHAVIQHQARLYVQTDNKTAALVTRLLGPSVPHLARRGVEQMEMFFSALVWYLDHHPELAALAQNEETR